MNEKQRIVLGWLIDTCQGERYMPEPIDLISQSVGMTSFGLYKKEKEALNNLDVVEQFEVLKVFAEWGIEEEQPPC